MARRRLTPESKAEFSKKITASAEQKAIAKAKAAGIDPSKLKVKGRTYEQIMADIAKVKASPAFKKKEAAIAKALAKKAAAQKPSTTKPRTTGTSRGGVGRGGIGRAGGIGGGMNWSTK